MEKGKFNINGATKAEIKNHCVEIIVTLYLGQVGVTIDHVLAEAKKLEEYFKQ